MSLCLTHIYLNLGVLKLKHYALFPIRPLPDRAKLHDDVNLFGNARITSDRSKIPTVASKHSKPIT